MRASRKLGVGRTNGIQDKYKSFASANLLVATLVINTVNQFQLLTMYGIRFFPQKIRELPPFSRQACLSIGIEIRCDRHRLPINVYGAAVEWMGEGELHVRGSTSKCVIRPTYRTMHILQQSRIK